MNRYIIPVCADVFVEAENVAQAAQLARNCKLIGARVGAHRSLHERDMRSYAIEHGELKFGRPVRLSSGEVYGRR